MYCNNCGERGHVFKMCINPVTSYGIILIDKKLPCDTKSVKLLMIRRKHSMAYTEFIRGKYDVDNTEYQLKLLSNMTFGEHHLIGTASFSELWTNHWGEGNDGKTHEYEVSFDKFSRIGISELLKRVNTGFLEPEWGFPKGRRIHRETDWNCAIREFSEETNLDRSLYTMFKNLSLTETFVGTNGITYKHIYYIATSNKLDLPESLTEEQCREISRIDWKTIQQCRELIRPHYIARNSMLDDLCKMLVTFTSDNNIASE